MYTPDARFAPLPSIVSRLIDNEAVIVLPEKGEVKVLNEVGARIWTLTDGTRTVGEIVDILCQEFAVDQATVQRDVLDFLEDLVRRDMVLPME